jgi:uncharacterized protein YydD (DUF2326 family)
LVALDFDLARLGGSQPFPKRTHIMKNPIEVLRTKEQELTQIKKEIDALRITARLLDDKNSALVDGKVDLRQVIEMP